MARLRDDHRDALRWVSILTGSEDLLGDNPVLARSIENRFPYLDPLHVLQVEMLQRLRAGRRRISSPRSAVDVERNRYRPAELRLNRVSPPLTASCYTC